jgi:hypothetical protein
MVRKVNHVNAGRVSACKMCVIKSKVKHGEARNGRQTPEYFVWSGMMRRCFYPQARGFHSYGGRGITVCERWLDYRNFIADMGRRPGTGMELDRLDTNGNYEPSNCRWVTQKENLRNKRNNLRITRGGETRCVAEWAEILGVDPGAVYSRIKSGHTDIDLLFSPVSKGQVLDRRKDKRTNRGK